MSTRYPGSEQIPAQLISSSPREKDLERAIQTGKYVLQEKIDGYFYQLEKTDDGQVYLFSRSKSKKTGELTEKINNVPHIKEWAEKYIPNGTILIGEIFVPGGTSKDCTRIMGCLPTKAIRRQHDEGWIHYYVHDMIKYEGKILLDNPFIERYNILYNSGLFNSNYYSLIPEVHLAENYEENQLEALQNIFARGGEGGVFKDRNATYKPGKRPKDNFKEKTIVTLDVIVIGFIEPEKEYKGKELSTWKYFVDNEPVTKAYYFGWKAGFVVGAYDGGELKEIGTISSGMTDFMREDTATYPEHYLNHVIEISAMSVDKERHSIRHGRFIRMRDDKNTEDCTFETIF